MNKSLHIPAFFDPRYKNSAYENMSKEDILLLICIAMIPYEEFITSSFTTTSNTTITVITNTQIIRSQLIKLLALETKNYFKNFFTLTNTQQLVINKLDIYFDSNSPKGNVALLEWWKAHAMKYLILLKITQDYLVIMLLTFSTLNQDHVTEDHADRRHVTKNTHVKEDHVDG